MFYLYSCLFPLDVSLVIVMGVFDFFLWIINELHTTIILVLSFFLSGRGFFKIFVCKLIVLFTVGIVVENEVA